jgi:hypothetical protein
MRTKLERVELHSPFFMGSTNMGDHLPKLKQGVELVYDDELDMLLISYEGRTAWMPIGNVKCMHPPPAVAVVKPIEPTNPNVAIKAQVATPQDHVFAGAGKGVTGQEFGKRK